MKRIDNATALFIFVAMLINMGLVFVAQAAEGNLSVGILLLFLLGFVGSIICTITRFVCSFYYGMKIKSKLKKIGLFLYMAVWVAIFVWSLGITLQETKFAFTGQELGTYNAYQCFLLGILIAQWLGDRIFLRGRKIDELHCI